MKPKLSGIQKDEIKMYIKNQLDISPLIENYAIAGEDFSNAIIKTLNRPDENISGVSFANAIIGEENGVVNLNRVIAQNCNFRSSIWKSKVWARNSDFRYSSMKDAFCPYFDYRYSDFRHCDFCGVFIQILSTNGVGVKLSDEFFKEIGQYWNVELSKKEP